MKKTKFFIASICFVLSSLFSVNAQWTSSGTNIWNTNLGYNVGIGTTNPQTNLDIYNSTQPVLRVLSNNPSGQGIPTLLLSRGGEQTLKLEGYPNVEGRISTTVGGVGFLTFYTGSNTEKLRIASNGFVGIGTTNPQTNLDIYNSTQPVLRVLSNNPSGQGIPTLLLSRGGEQTLKLEGYPNVEGRISSVQGGVGFLTFYTGQNHESLRISPSGYIGINTANPQKQLDVNGTIHAREVLVDNDNWADFVFDKEYALPKLSEVNEFVQTNGHLPNIPSATDVKEKGVNVSEMQAKLLQKIEELTLYVIQQDQKIEKLQKQVDNK